MFSVIFEVHPKADADAFTAAAKLPEGAPAAAGSASCATTACSIAARPRNIIPRSSARGAALSENELLRRTPNLSGVSASRKKPRPYKTLSTASASRRSASLPSRHFRASAAAVPHVGF